MNTSDNIVIGPQGLAKTFKGVHALKSLNLRYGAALPSFSSELPLVALIHPPDAKINPLEPTFYEDRLAFASRWPNARIVIAEGSNHFIATKRPDLAVQAIQDVVEAARTGQPLASK